MRGSGGHLAAVSRCFGAFERRHRCFSALRGWLNALGLCCGGAGVLVKIWWGFCPPPPRGFECALLLNAAVCRDHSRGFGRGEMWDVLEGDFFPGIY